MLTQETWRLTLKPCMFTWAIQLQAHLGARDAHPEDIEAYRVLWSFVGSSWSFYGSSYVQKVHFSMSKVISHSQKNNDLQ